MKSEYSAIVMDHFNQPRDVGVFDVEDPHVITGRAGIPGAGDFLQLQCRINSDDRIESACFKAYGNPYTIAASSYAAEWLKNKPLAEVKKINHHFFVKALEIPRLKLASAILVEDAIRAVIASHQRQHEVA